MSCHAYCHWYFNVLLAVTSGPRRGRAPGAAGPAAGIGPAVGKGHPVADGAHLNLLTPPRGGCWRRMPPVAGPRAVCRPVARRWVAWGCGECGCGVGGWTAEDLRAGCSPEWGFPAESALPRGGKPRRSAVGRQRPLDCCRAGLPVAVRARVCPAGHRSDQGAEAHGGPCRGAILNQAGEAKAEDPLPHRIQCGG